MLRCNQVSELIGSDRVLTAGLRTRLAVRLHLMMCDHCSAYARSLRQMAALARRVAYSEAAITPVRHEEILAAVRQEVQKFERE